MMDDKDTLEFVRRTEKLAGVPIKELTELFMKQSAVVQWALGLHNAHISTGEDVLVDKEMFDILNEIRDG